MVNGGVMKKIVLFLAILMLLPQVCLATSISSFTINSPESASIGDEIKLNVTINFSDLDKKSKSTQGIITVGYSFKMDENVFELKSITSSSKGLDTNYKKSGDYYTIVATINDNNVDRCLDGESFCENYKGTITLKVKDTKEKSTTISYDEASASVVEVSKVQEMTNLESVEEIINKLSGSLNVIKQKKSSLVWYIGNIKINEKVESTNNKETNNTSTNNNTTTDKNKNTTSNIIKSFIVKEYDFHYNPEQKNYDLKVDEDTNSLDIVIKLLDSEAKYEIIGADNLKKNNNEVTVNITDKNGNVDTYTINVIYSEEETKIEETKEKEWKLSKKQIKMISIGSGIFLLLIILFGIIIHIKNKKENKKYDNI